MAEKLVRTLLCDIDGAEADDVVTVFLECDGVRVKVDLCPKHAGPIRKACEAGVQVTQQADDLPGSTLGALTRRIGGPRG
jgi:hypothetical protein